MTNRAVLYFFGWDNFKATFHFALGEIRCCKEEECKQDATAEDDRETGVKYEGGLRKSFREVEREWRGVLG